MLGPGTHFLLGQCLVELFKPSKMKAHSIDFVTKMKV